MSKTKTRARQESGGGRRGQSGWVCGEMGVREWGKVWEENLNVDHWYFPVPMVTPDWFPPFTLHTHTSFCYSHFHTQWDNIPHCRMLNTHTHSHTHNRMHTHTHTHTHACITHIVQYILCVRDRWRWFLHNLYRCQWKASAGGFVYRSEERKGGWGWGSAWETPKFLNEWWHRTLMLTLDANPNAWFFSLVQSWKTQHGCRSFIW